MQSFENQAKEYNSIHSEHNEPLHVSIDRKAVKKQNHEFPGWGSFQQIRIGSDELSTIEEDRKVAACHQKLGEWPATAICGNDILSSCLYVSGLVAGKAGKLAPVALAMVGGILYLYRFVYGEVINAIPMNGGSYNVLLNTTTKRIASFAASLAILSYLATGVVSGTSACTYLQMIFPWIDIVSCTILLLLFFSILSFIGITESAVVALVIFVGHVGTLMVLCGCCIYYIVQDGGVTMLENFQTEYPAINMAGSIVDGNVGTALFFGLATSMLGISGFESSSQFVEEQQPGVFPKTLRNMWFGVVLFNPLLSFLSMGVMPLEDILVHRNTVLAKMGYHVGGKLLERWVCIDAFIVLSGAVLTAYVGIMGLVRRLACDRVLPSFLMQTNAWRGTNHYIIFTYFMIATSLVLLLNGDVETLSGVYTYAFLGLMILFTCGCMLLKFKRAELKRTIVAPWWSCFLGIFMVLVSFMGNLLGDPMILTYFALYFLVVIFIVSVMFNRILLLRLFLYVLQRICPSRNAGSESLSMTGARGGRTIAKVDILFYTFLIYTLYLDYHRYQPATDSIFLQEARFVHHQQSHLICSHQ